MTNQTIRTCLISTTTAGLIITATILVHYSRVEAQTNEDDQDSRIGIGVQIAAVPLTSATHQPLFFTDNRYAVRLAPMALQCKEPQ
jgi:hypothetical protein